MINTTSYYVKSEGIKLPDGTVFGAGTTEAFRVVDEYGETGFHVYEVFGTQMVNIFGDGVAVTWRQMRDALNERIAYQTSIGNTVLRCGKVIMEV